MKCQAEYLLTGVVDIEIYWNEYKIQSLIQFILNFSENFDYSIKILFEIHQVNNQYNFKILWKIYLMNLEQHNLWGQT